MTMRTNHRLMYLATIAIVVAFLGTAVTIAYRVEPPPELDVDTGCPMSGESGAVTVIIDKTDDIPFSSQTANLVRDIFFGLDQYDLFSIYTLDISGKLNANPAFSKCHPGDESTIDPLTGNRILARNIFAREFEKPFEIILSDLLVSASAESSEIARSIGKILYSHHSSFNSELVTRRKSVIYLVSDILENSPDAIAYQVGRRGSANIFESVVLSELKGRVLDSNISMIISVFPRAAGESQNWIMENFWNPGLELLGIDLKVISLSTYERLH